MTNYELILEGYFASKAHMNIVQIGANDGKINDPIYRFVIDNKDNTRLLLIEPQSEIMPFLKENYSAHNSVTFFNGAIGQAGYLSLFRVKPELWNYYNPPYLKDAPAYRVPSGFASSSIEHVYKHARDNFNIGLPLELCIEEIRVPTRNLQDFAPDISWINDIDLLQVDTEGSDDVVLYSCNIDEIKPRMINYEFIHLGKIKNERLSQYLIQQGYKIIQWSGTDRIALLGYRR